MIHCGRELFIEMREAGKLNEQNESVLVRWLPCLLVFEKLIKNDFGCIGELIGE